MVITSEYQRAVEDAKRACIINPAIDGSPTALRIARALLLADAVVRAAREYQREVANPGFDATMRRVKRDALFQALARLDE